MGTLDTHVTLELPEELVAACNIRNIDQSLLRAMKARAAEEGLTLRDWAILAFSMALETKSLGSARGSTRGVKRDVEKAPTVGLEPAAMPLSSVEPDQSPRAEKIEGAKCFCGADVYPAKTSQGIDKWKCEKGHWSAPREDRVLDKWKARREGMEE